MKVLRSISLLAVACLLVSCSEKRPAQPVAIPVAQPPPVAPKPSVNVPPPPPLEAVAAQTPTPAAAAPPSTIEYLQNSTELADLTKALQIFVYEKKRFPNSVTELAQFTPNGIPKLPPGYRYVIDRSTKQVLISK